ncbi:ribonuclease PH [Synechococcus sp. PCC 7335]|uniref:ribonuclease PH n=1 Tax=Synechococcus sp. (strain ATCC 29403 / PCC 7335) TaxID=91464 RepID=UPI00017EB0BE|nr:ribonuclease PH [Synechococcus sp. PCC 7335]EDX83756.1 ribonuclease PH [Synechococcus sp. PCC 7335]
MPWQRPDQRQPDQLRPFKFERQFTQYSAGSVLAHCGNTRVLCTASVLEGVPRFLKDSGQGWLTAEYRMLPGSTQTRKSREFMKLSGRTQEIQRLIGRSLRAALDMEALGERTITIDADVLQADGGTRTTSITGAYVALEDAIAHLIKTNELTTSPLRHQIAATSVGLIEGDPFLDLNYPEDFAADIDFNVVMNEKLEFIEVQGTAEAGSFTRSQLNAMLEYAEKGISQLMQIQKATLSESL